MSWTLSYEDIICLENLLEAWREFARGKRQKRDVQEFERHLISNILGLHEELACDAYRHGDYHHFKISDPKPRDIHKASVRDRLLHHALYRKLYPLYDRTFISDSFSCREGKGTHRAMNRFRKFARIVSKNDMRTAWVLKCDIRKFFASIDQQILMEIFSHKIHDERISMLIRRVVESFDSGTPGKGLPLGNLTSQLLVNIYMNEFDRFVKQDLRVKHYIRYADDFVLFSPDHFVLEDALFRIAKFLREELKLELHPKKVSISTFASGIDFLGWVHFPHHRVLRTATKRRMLRALRLTSKPETRVSYRGMLSHGNAHKIKLKAGLTG